MRRMRRPVGRNGPGLARRTLDLALALAIIALVALAAAYFQDRADTKLAGTAIVHDGDTLTLGGERIRLTGIDAPELAQTCTRDGQSYPCGRAARDRLVELVSGEEISCAGAERDKYRRLLAHCRARSDLGAEMVSSGWAIAYGGYEADQRLARAGKRGLWQGTFDAPREWRARHGEMADETAPIQSFFEWIAGMLGFG